MAMLPFRPTPFFRNKNRAFWNLQIGGWVGVTLFRAASALVNSQPLDFLILILIGSITGFSISLVFSVIYRWLIDRRPLVTWGVTGLVLAVGVGLYAFVDSWVISLYYPDREIGLLQRFFSYFYLDLTLLGAWSALYYAINYFLQVERQADQLERLEAQATAAQLAMLRYQLNPHFLFNTLNSISTLVLLKQTEPANAMLTRLSSFLRHTLLTQPTGKVTLDQEVETLKLYLGIERMRFEERLRTDFQIEPAAREAMLPAMLLQPLVENAIKYGVSQQEEGAKISIAARVVGSQLRITVSDTGPGLNAGGQRHRLPGAMTGEGRTESTGVGLANIRDRLVQAYGDAQLFEIRTPPEGGFTVVIELPFENVDSDIAASAGSLQVKPESMKPETASAVSIAPEAPTTTKAPEKAVRGSFLGVGRPIGSKL
ncbi:sensor histidine kinase [Allopontixanthobacter sp.]|uniref:sensor histidine kinase n=1 Tax=Allopontixanthobacter sp. TaxID=2906452 RepID=UPI002AB8BB39|nr:histidine kinase [Allopontixanthobacter sp.]MDZ4308650.1 histidine kinase [Allopontixanthobacter sp.]